MNWMAEWLAAFLESNVDDLAEKDAIVLDQIREHLTGSPSGGPEPLDMSAELLGAFLRGQEAARPATCPQPCEHLSQHDAREGRTCPEHPCTCTDREEGTE